MGGNPVIPWSTPLTYPLPLKNGRTLRRLHDGRDVFTSGVNHSPAAGAPARPVAEGRREGEVGGHQTGHRTCRRRAEDAWDDPVMARRDPGQGWFTARRRWHTITTIEV